MATALQDELTASGHTRFDSLSSVSVNFLAEMRKEPVHTRAVLATGYSDESSYVSLYLNPCRFATRQATKDAYLTMLKDLEAKHRLRHYGAGFTFARRVHDDFFATPLPEIPEELDEMEFFSLECRTCGDPECQGTEWTEPETP